jgi:enamine deaminase RidA (YjgF/YER057c/UK114 family)
MPHSGYSNGIVSGPGRMVHVAGQVDMRPDGSIAHPDDLVAQAEGALAGVVRVLRDAGALPEHVVRVRILVTSADDYGRLAKSIGEVWRRHFGRWFPAMTLVQAARLFDAEALIEIEADAVVPGR